MVLNELDGKVLVAALTRREREILEAMWQFGNEKSAAENLVTSIRTLQTHLQNIHTKLGVRYTLEAIRLFKQAEWQPAAANEVPPLRRTAKLCRMVPKPAHLQMVDCRL